MSFDLSARLAERRAAHLYRQRPLLTSPQDVHIRVDGQPLLAFCSNDYLGLANHPAVAEAMVEGVRRWGVGLLADAYGWNTVFYVIVAVGALGAIVFATMWKAPRDGYERAKEINYEEE